VRSWQDSQNACRGDYVDVSEQIVDRSNDSLVRVKSTIYGAFTFQKVVSFPQNVTIDFGASRTLGRIELYTSDMYEILHYAIDYWDGAGWVQLVEITNNVVIHRTHTFAQVSSPKIRVRTYSGPTGQTIYARLNEVQVFAN